MHAPLRCASSRMSNTVAPDACEISSSTGIVAGVDLVALSTEHERLELDVERLLPHLAGAKPKRPEIDGRHGVSVAPWHQGSKTISPPARLLPYDHGS